jgi:thiol-disulfide isomerase/thioredoxin
MSQDVAGKPRGGPLKWALWGVALFGVAAVLYIIVQAMAKPGQPNELSRLATGDMAKLKVLAEAGPAPANSVLDAEGKPVRVADFRGQVVVVNLWATWCAPCVIEMPTLAELAAAYEGRKVVVMPISLDGDKDEAKARAFIAKHAPLKFYRDPKLAYPYALVPPTSGMPTTVIFGPDGVERARLAGEADWSSEDARKVIDAVLAAG